MLISIEAKKNSYRNTCLIITAFNAGRILMSVAVCLGDYISYWAIDDIHSHSPSSANCLLIFLLLFIVWNLQRQLEFVSCFDRHKRSIYNVKFMGVMYKENIVQGGPKMSPFFVRLFVTLPNVNRFSKLFHCQNQEKISNNTITKDLTMPQVYRYTTLWNVSVLKATIENKRLL